MPRLSDRTDDLLFGRDPHTSTKLVALAGGLFFVAAGVRLLAALLGTAAPTFDALWTGVGVAMLLLATWGAYLNDGLLLSVALAGGLGLGFFLPGVALDLAHAGEVTLLALTSGTLSGIGLGIVGFVVGAVLRRIRDRL